MDFLKGKKTKFVALIGAVLGALDLIFGGVLQQVGMSTSGGDLIIAAAAVFGFRDAMK